MAAIVVNRGLQVIGGRASSTADAFNAIQVMSIDDKATAFVAGDTSLGSPTNESDAAFDATPTRTGQTIRHTATFGTGVTNVATIRRIALHNDTAANVTGASNTLVAGVDTQSMNKDGNNSSTFNFDLLYTSA